MANFKTNLGISKLAKTLDRRMSEHGEGQLTPDFGKIQNDKSLLMNTFPVPIPASDYSVCGTLCGISGGRRLAAGDRVLVIWANDEPVVVDVIRKASSI